MRAFRKEKTYPNTYGAVETSFLKDVVSTNNLGSGGYHHYKSGFILGYPMPAYKNNLFSGNKKYVSSSLVLPGERALTITQREKDILMLKHREKIGGKATNMLDIVRTRHETVGMIAGNVRAIATAYRHLRKGKWKKAKRALRVTKSHEPIGKDVPARWLELQYGWLPLLGDIHAIGNQMFREPVFSVRSTRFKTEDFKGGRTFEDMGHQVRNIYSERVVTRYTFVTEFEILSPAVTTLDNLGVLNPGLVAWEAVPFSFVLDWLIPIGDWIGTLTDLKGVRIKRHYYTQASEHTILGSVDTRFRYVPYGEPTIMAVRYRAKVRHAEMPYIPLPRFKNPLSLSHFANAFSLLAVVLNDKKK